MDVELNKKWLTMVPPPKLAGAEVICTASYRLDGRLHAGWIVRFAATGVYRICSPEYSLSGVPPEVMAKVKDYIAKGEK